MSGAKPERLSEVMASARRLPDCTCGNAAKSRSSCDAAAATPFDGPRLDAIGRYGSAPKRDRDQVSVIIQTREQSPGLLKASCENAA